MATVLEKTFSTSQFFLFGKVCIDGWGSLGGKNSVNIASKLASLPSPLVVSFYIHFIFEGGLGRGAQPGEGAFEMYK